MSLIKVFVDSDVVISSLISQKGAAYFLITRKPAKTKFSISNFSLKEQKKVIKRLKINPQKLQKMLKKITIVQLREKLKKIKKEYQSYVIDPNDSHIAAAAKQAKTNFLITYNQKHFKRNKIKKDFDIILLTPGQLLQYLRSLKSIR